MLAWQPTRDLEPGEFKNGIVVVSIGLGTSVFLAGMVALSALVGGLFYLGGTLALAAIGAPDWLSQILRRVPTRGRRPGSDVAARGFLVSGALAALMFGIWGLLR